MANDLENVTKASQTAQLLFSDLHDLVLSDNLILSDIALAEIEIVQTLRQRLDRLALNIEAMDKGK